jgi:hypothetical protein
MEHPIEDLSLQIRGKLVRILVLVQLNVGVKVLESICGEPANLRLYDVGL